MEIKYINSLEELGENPSGLYQMPDEVYRSAPGINQSLIKNWIDDRYAVYANRDIKKESKSFDYGNIFEAFATMTFDSIAVMPDELLVDSNGRPSKSKNCSVWKKFEGANQDRFCLLESEAREFAMAADNLSSAADFPIKYNRFGYDQANKPCKLQVVCFSRINGILCKGKADLLSETKIDDIKTSVNISDKKIKRAFEEFRYDIQAAFYLRIFSDFIPTLNEFNFYVSCSKPPYLARKISLSRRTLDHALTEIMAILPVLDYTIRENKWPEYPREYELDMFNYGKKEIDEDPFEVL